jgi:hypothetical protein
VLAASNVQLVITEELLSSAILFHAMRLLKRLNDSWKLSDD